MAIITNGEIRDYWKKVADAVVNGKMQVTDADVKTVLDTIKSVLQSGVNTYDTNALAELQAIKNKLNGTLLTQLTGSIVEQGRVNNFLVTAGSRTLFVRLDVKDYTRYAVESRSTIAHTYRIDVDFNVQSGAVSGYRATKTFSSNNAGIILSTPDYLQTPYLNCFIINNDTVDHYYDAGVILFK